jgi:hypothetical protein
MRNFQVVFEAVRRLRARPAPRVAGDRGVIRLIADVLAAALRLEVDFPARAGRAAMDFTRLVTALAVGVALLGVFRRAAAALP